MHNKNVSLVLLRDFIVRGALGKIITTEFKVEAGEGIVFSSYSKGIIYLSFTIWLVYAIYTLKTNH